jgi:predicted GNAT family acetyltransferase
MKYGKCVSAVYTPPEERGKGYAYNLIYRISKELLDSGDKYCVLYTDDSNPISNHVYEKIGYKRKSDWEEIDFIK